MTHGINNLQDLPDIEEIKSISQSLAVLDLILVQEWEYRYFSFNSKWDSNEMLASMRNGEGDEYFILFSDVGAVGKIFSTDIELMSSKDNVLSSIPDDFNSFKIEPAFNLDKLSCCFWRITSDKEWKMSPALKEIPFLRFIIGKEKYYQKWAEAYFEVELDEKVINAIFKHEPLNSTLINNLNEETSLESIKEEVKEIGYPIE